MSEKRVSGDTSLVWERALDGLEKKWYWWLLAAAAIGTSVPVLAHGLLGANMRQGNIAAPGVRVSWGFDANGEEIGMAVLGFGPRASAAIHVSEMVHDVTLAAYPAGSQTLSLTAQTAEASEYGDGYAYVKGGVNGLVVWGVYAEDGQWCVKQVVYSVPVTHEECLGGK